MAIKTYIIQKTFINIENPQFKINKISFKNSTKMLKKREKLQHVGLKNWKWPFHLKIKPYQQLHYSKHLKDN